MIKYEDIKERVWLASPLGCYLLGGCDIGLITLNDGTQHYITWGRNLTLEETDSYDVACVENVDFMGESIYELILSSDLVESLCSYKKHNVPSNISKEGHLATETLKSKRGKIVIEQGNVSLYSFNTLNDEQAIYKLYHQIIDDLKKEVSE